MRSREKNEEAVSLVERAAHIQEKSLPKDSPVTRETLEQLARLYEKTGKTETAKQTRDRLKAQVEGRPAVPLHKK